jgi:hypothetical protein
MSLVHDFGSVDPVLHIMSEIIFPAYRLSADKHAFPHIALTFLSFEERNALVMHYDVSTLVSSQKRNGDRASSAFE